MSNKTSPLHDVVTLSVALEHANYQTFYFGSVLIKPLLLMFFMSLFPYEVADLYSQSGCD